MSRSAYRSPRRGRARQKLSYPKCGLSVAEPFRLADGSGEVVAASSQGIASLTLEADQ